MTGRQFAESARKTGLSLEYVHGVARLLEKGEQRLLRSVESGTIPVSVAVEISEAPDHDVQATLSSAYERGLLKGRKLLAAKKVIETRRRRGKGLAATGPKSRQRLSADALVKAYQEDTDRKQIMIRKTDATRNRILFITEALRKLGRDEGFLALLEDEELATMPEPIAARLGLSSGAQG